ncbi:hypothetical protein [Massilibacteroides sp.]|uniref:hypothetical protein n=1 Tax=Massilibacteroides sp. TaxID=2034766 RepID=UPI0026236F81|nr:hypothetical protein [Massilibacteroides sp.]MDD4516690.1 hypothetical protein [Massilibacteroides sp.]
MNKIFIITFVTFSFLFSGTLLAQNKHQGHRFDRKAFIEKRNSFLINEVGLTSEEAAKFIPLYDEFQRKKFEAGQRCRELSREMRKKENATSENYLHVVDECVEVRLKEAQLDKEYYKKFKNILSPEKLYKLTGAEYKFAREFMKGSNNRK